MEVRKYDKTQDFEAIKAWGKQWGADYDVDLFPPTGYIVPGIAAYFIYYTDSKVVWLENMVCNKEVPKEQREVAIEQVVTAVLKEVNSKGYKVAYANTSNRIVIDRAIKHNAKASESTLLTLAFKN